jgi:glycosyltransferase involved in cell wall biosynthesis
VPSQLRLLLLLPFAPRLDAAHGGGRVLAWFLSKAANRHRVAILYLRGLDEPGVDDFIRERCELVQEVFRPSARNSFTGRLLRGVQLISCMIQLRPFWVSDWSSISFKESLCTIVREFQPDIVQAELHVMGQYFPVLDSLAVPRVLVEHEPGTRAAPYLRGLPAPLAGVTNRIEGLSWRKYEAALYKQVDGIVVFTERDRGAVQELARQTPIRVIPPGITVPDRQLNPRGQLPLNLVFVGNFIHPPNADAAIWLTRVIYPKVQSRIPDLRLFIVGDRPPAEIKQLASENVVITGWVPDVAPFLDQASLFVAPMRLGGGMRMKVVEALAAGKAVVATPLAVEGLDLVDGIHISLAESEAGLAEHIFQLLTDPDKRLSLGKAARAWAREHLGGDQSMRSYEAFYAELLEDSRRPRTSAG